MKKLLFLIAIAFAQIDPISAQEFPDSIYSDSDSIVLARFIRKDFKRYIWRRAETLFEDKDINKFIRFTLLSSDKIGEFIGFNLHFTSRFFIVVEVKKPVQFKDRTKPPEWYLGKLKRRRIIIVEIPRHLLGKD